MPFKSQENNPYSFTVKTDEKNFLLEQDVSFYNDYAARQRQLDEMASSKRKYRSFAIIPDIVAIDLLTKYNLNIHDPNFMNDPAEVKRMKNIILSDYPKLLTSNVKKV